MEHDVLIKYENDGWRVYLDDIPRTGSWFTKTELKFAKHQARLLAKQYKLKEYRVIDLHHYEEDIKVDYDNE